MKKKYRCFVHSKLALFLLLVVILPALLATFFIFFITDFFAWPWVLIVTLVLIRFHFCFFRCRITDTGIGVGKRFYQWEEIKLCKTLYDDVLVWVFPKKEYSIPYLCFFCTDTASDVTFSRKIRRQAVYLKMTKKHLQRILACCGDKNPIVTDKCLNL